MARAEASADKLMAFPKFVGGSVTCSMRLPPRKTQVPVPHKGVFVVVVVLVVVVVGVDVDVVVAVVVVAEVAEVVVVVVGGTAVVGSVDGLFDRL